MVHITDVLAVSMMLGITAQVKEAGIAWDKGEKKSKDPGPAAVGAPGAAGHAQGPSRGQEQGGPTAQPPETKGSFQKWLRLVSFVPLCDPQMV